MEIVGIIFLGILIFIILGIGGWFIELFGYIFDFLLEGVFKSIGCLFWLIIIIVILIGIL